MALSDAFVEINADTKPFDRQLLALQRRVSKMSFEISITLNTTRIAAQLINLRRQLADLTASVLVQLDTARFEAQLTALRRTLAGLDATINVDARTAAAAAQIQALIISRTVIIHVRTETSNADKGLSGLNGKVKSLIKSLGSTALTGAKFALIGAAAASAAGQIVGLAAALAQLSGLLFALPAVVLMAGAAFGTLKLAMTGVNDAISAGMSGDVKAYGEALAKLAPAAQSAVRQIVALKPAFDSLRNSVQQKFFAEFSADITRTAQALMGPLRSGLVEIARQSGETAAGLMRTFRSASSVSALTTVLDATGLAVGRIGAALPPLLQGFLDLAGAISPALAGISLGLSENLTYFGKWMSSVAKSGTALEAFNTAKDVLSALAQVFIQLGGIISAVFSAARASGQDVLGVLGQLLQSVNAFLSSAEGQDALVAIFKALGQVGSALTPIITALGTAIGDIAPYVGQLATALGPGLTAVVTTLGNVLVKLAPTLVLIGQALSDAFSDPKVQESLLSAAQAVADLLDALIPLIPAVVDLAATFLILLAPIVEILAPGIKLVAMFLALKPVLYSLVAIVLLLAAAWVVLMAAAFPITATLLAIIVVAGLLYKYWDQITKAMGIAWQALVDAVMVGVNWIIDQWNSLWEIGKTVVSKIVAAWDSVVAFFTELPGKIMGALSSLWSTISNAFTTAFDAVTSTVASWIDTVVTFFTELPGKIWNGLVTIVTSLPGLFKQAFDAVLFAIGYYIGLTLGLMIYLPQRIIAALSALGELLRGWANTAFQMAITAITTAVEWIVAFMIALPGRIIAAVVGLAQLLWSWATTAFQMAKAAVMAGVNAIVDFVTGLPGMIVSAVSSLGSLLRGWATSAFKTAYNAVTSGVNSIITFMRRVPGMILSAVSSLMSTLGSFFSSVFNSVSRTVSSGVSSVVGFFTAMPGKIISGIGNLASKIGGVFSAIWSTVSGTINSLITSIVNLFKTLPSKILAAIGNIGSTIKSGITSGLGKAASLLGFANGGIVTSATPAVVGEAGPEVIIPLSRPARAMQLVQASGLHNMIRNLAGSSIAPTGGGGGPVNNFTIVSNASDPMTVAYRTAALLTPRLTLAGA